MLQNYIKIAFRSLWKNRVFSGINVVGLALGIAAFGLILEYVSFEYSINRFHQKLPDLYRVLYEKDGKSWEHIVPGLAPRSQQQFSDITSYCRIADGVAQGTITINNGSAQSYRESDLAYVDGSFFTLFSFPLVTGSGTSLRSPNTVALSETYARKYFGTAQALGKTLTLINQFGKTLYTVSAVYRDLPRNSDLQFSALFSLQTLASPGNLNGSDWARIDGLDSEYIMTFLELRSQADPTQLAETLTSFKKKLTPRDEAHVLLQPLRHVHLAESLGDTRVTSGSLSFVYLLSGIAILILLIAWFNYINLSTAGSLKRTKEIGVRKVIGARPGQLIGQFLGESLMLNGLALGLAILLIMAVQQPFNKLIGLTLSLADLAVDSGWLIGLGALLLGTLVSGGYVAFVLTSFRPIQILKGVVSSVGQRVQLRQTLVVVQFSISVALLIGMIVMVQQLRFMQQKDLGVNLSQRLVIRQPATGTGGTALQQQITQLPYVRNYTNSGIVPGGNYNYATNGITRRNPRPGDNKKNYSMAYIDDRYLSTYQITLTAGRPFSPAEVEAGPEKSGKLMINETAARQLGFPAAQAAVGQQILWGKPFEVVGVISDYHHQSVQQAIDPIIFMPSRTSDYLTIDLNTADPSKKLTELEQIYKATCPGNPFEFFFVDERYNQQYQTSQRYERIVSLGAGLAILIACLGLFGLATHTAQQRTKEIGVRKVLGASVTSIVTLLSKDFLKLVLIAIVIASPLAWYAMHQWLQDFAYKIDLAWWIFALAGLFAVAIALLTVSLQSMKAALMNPVKSLRMD